MKLKVTPLNIVAAVSLAYTVYRIITPARSSTLPISTNWVFILVLCCLVVVTVVTDLIFRFTLKSLKRIWIVELVFIALAVILMLILQKVV